MVFEEVGICFVSWEVIVWVSEDVFKLEKMEVVGGVVLWVVEVE